MKHLQIKSIREEDVTTEMIEKMTNVIIGKKKDNFDSTFMFFKNWFDGAILGSKMTFVAEFEGELIGVTRFWESPHCDYKWLNEGLEVIESKRGLGVGKALVEHGMSELKKLQVQELYVNIAQTNDISIKLHESIGFSKVSTGSLNSFGDFRANVDQYKIEVFK